MGHELLYLSATIGTTISVLQLKDQVKLLVDAVANINSFKQVPCPHGVLNEFGNELKNCFLNQENILQVSSPISNLHLPETISKSLILVFLIFAFPTLTIICDIAVHDCKANNFFRTLGSDCSLRKILDIHSQKCFHHLPEIFTYLMLFLAFNASVLHGYEGSNFLAAQFLFLLIKSFVISIFASVGSGVAPCLRLGLHVGQFLSSFFVLVYMTFFVTVGKLVCFFLSQKFEVFIDWNELLPTISSIFLTNFLIAIALYIHQAPLIGDTLRSIKKHYNKTSPKFNPKFHKTSSWLDFVSEEEKLSVQLQLQRGMSCEKAWPGNLLGLDSLQFLEEFIEPFLQKFLKIILNIDKRALFLSSCFFVNLLGCMNLQELKKFQFVAWVNLLSLIFSLPVAAHPILYSANKKVSNLCKLATITSISSIGTTLFYFFNVKNEISNLPNSNHAILSFALGPCFLLVCVYADRNQGNSFLFSKLNSFCSECEEQEEQVEDIVLEPTKDSTSNSNVNQQNPDAFEQQPNIQSLLLTKKIQKNLRHLLFSTIFQIILLPIAWMCQSNLLFAIFWQDSPLPLISTLSVLLVFANAFQTFSNTTISQTDLWWSVIFGNLNDFSSKNDLTSVVKINKKTKERKVIPVQAEKRLCDYARHVLAQVFCYDGLELCSRVAFILNFAFLLWQIGVGFVLMGSSCDLRGGSCREMDFLDGCLTWSYFGGLVVGTGALWRGCS